MQRKIEILTPDAINSQKNGSLYNIYVGDLAQTWNTWFDAFAKKQIILVCDENTAKFCLPLFVQKTGLTNYTLIVTEAGELHKNINTCHFIWSKMLQAGIDRQAICINLGGGVVGDMAGFCAATFKRGIDFVQVPTTLLSQIDSSIGGKLGIDFQGVKNSIGVFNDPEAVFLDSDFLATLSQREIRSGFAEMIKHALIADAIEWKKLSQLERLDNIYWDDFIVPSLAVKRQIVEEDPFEKGIRKALNFGHTIGHAVESYFLESESPLLHGEAIAIGMICEAYLSFKNGNLSKVELDEIVALMKRFYDKKTLPTDSFGALINSMKQDKKNENQAINFTFLRGVGQAKINQTADNEAIISSLVYYNNVF
jgi:3-dehydroquinate synthase